MNVLFIEFQLHSWKSGRMSSVTSTAKLPFLLHLANLIVTPKMAGEVEGSFQPPILVANLSLLSLSLSSCNRIPHVPCLYELPQLCCHAVIQIPSLLTLLLPLSSLLTPVPAHTDCQLTEPVAMFETFYPPYIQPPYISIQPPYISKNHTHCI